MISPVDLTVLRRLTRRDSASLPEIVAACAMSPNEVLFRLATLARLRFATSRLAKAEDAPCLVYFATDEGRLVAGLLNAKVTPGVLASVALRTAKE